MITTTWRPVPGPLAAGGLLLSALGPLAQDERRVPGPVLPAVLDAYRVVLLVPAAAGDEHLVLRLALAAAADERLARTLVPVVDDAHLVRNPALAD